MGAEEAGLTVQRRKSKWTTPTIRGHSKIKCEISLAQIRLTVE